MRPRNCFKIALVAVSVAASIGEIFTLLFLWGVGVEFGSSAATQPGGIHLLELTAAQDLFALAGRKAVVLNYSGGDVDFWVEIESQGRKQKFGEGLGSLCREKSPGPGQIIEGYFLLVCSEHDDLGMQTWSLACKRGVVAGGSSGVHISASLTQPSFREAWKDGQFVSTRSRLAVWVGEKRPNRVRARDEAAATDYVWTEKSSVQSPLPMGREVCIKEIRVRNKKKDQFAQDCTIKVICKVASPIENLASFEPLAK
jgi:hypothetical protein